MSYRNHILLGLARLSPKCFSCDKRNEGDIVACHSNSQRDGKGMGLKASDAAVSFCCAACHQLIDQSKINAADRRSIWEQAHIATLRWLIESGHLVASIEPIAPPEPKPKVKRAMPKGRKLVSGAKLQSRGFDQSAMPRKIPSHGFQKRAPK